MRKKQGEVDVLMDSGAFSAWFHDEAINLDAYMAFLEEHAALFSACVSLDKIPGTKKRPARTSIEVEQAAAQSYQNFNRMRKRGIEAMPVFHMGEDWRWLDRMLEDHVPYIGLATSRDSKRKYDRQRAWLDQCFARLTDEQGRPYVKTHGFGLTQLQLIARYPWFSVDSTAWALAGAYGEIMLPTIGANGDFDFIHHVRFGLTDRDTMKKNPILRLGPTMRASVNAYFDRIGTDVARIRETQAERWTVNLHFYHGFEEALAKRAADPVPFQHRRGAAVRARPSWRVVPFDYSPKIIFATILKYTSQAEAMTRAGIRNRLISYYDCRKEDADALEEYVQNGFIEPQRRSRRAATAIIARRRMSSIEARQTGVTENE